MGDAYRLDELRFIQEYNRSSAVAGTSIDCTDFVVPANTVRTILWFSYQVDIAENRWISVMLLGATTHAIRGPFNYDGNNGAPCAVLEQGMEVRMLPGDRIRVDRSAATAGSTATIRIRYIDHFIPYQKYIEPQDARKKLTPFWRAAREAAGGGAVSGGGGSEAGGGFGEPGGTPGEPLL